MDLIDYVNSDPEISNFEHFSEVVLALTDPRDRGSDLNFKPKVVKSNNKAESIQEIYQLSTGDLGDLRTTSIPKPVSLEKPRAKLSNKVHRGKQRYSEISPYISIPYHLYRKISRDSTVTLGMDFIVGVISSLPFHIECHDPEIQTVINNLYSRHHDNLIRQCVRIGYRNGFCFGEKVWQNRKAKFVTVKNGEEEVAFDGFVTDLSYIKMIDPESSYLKYHVDRQDRLHHVTQYNSVGKEIRVNRNQLFWFSLNSEFSNIFGQSKFKGIYPWWHYDKVVFQLTLRHIEKVGSPHLEARYPKGNKKYKGVKIDNSQLIIKYVEALKATGGVSLPSERDDKGEYRWSIEYKHPTNANTDSQVDMMNLLDRKKLNALGIPDSILLSGSSHAEADAKTDTWVMNIEDPINQIEEAIYNDIICYLVEYNFGEEAKDLVDFKIDRSNLGKRNLLKEIFINAIRSDSSMPGYRPTTVVNKEKVAKELGISMSSFDYVYEVDDNFEGKDLQKSKQNEEDSNNRNRNRVNPTDRSGREKATKKDTVG